MKRLFFCLMLAFVATCVLSCKKSEGQFKKVEELQ